MIIVFDTKQEAIDYRKNKGCGGWIFNADCFSILFSLEYTPTMIINHKITKGISGKFI